MQETEANSVSQSPLQQTSGKSHETFINDFKNTLKTLFREENDINQLSVNRGIAPETLKRIMDCNPMSLSIPKEYGGRGGSVREMMELLSAASYESMAMSLTLGINNALFLQPLTKYGAEETKKAVYKRFLEEQNMGGLMITEPDYGTDALNMQTAYTEKADHYHLKGTKHWAGLTGQANFWLLTGRKKTEKGDLMRDLDFFVCDNDAPDQKIVVEEYFENLGLYQIPYGRNILDVKIPKMNRLIPETTGVKMMIDLLHRSRMHFPGMGLGFIKRMLDEGIAHCQQRLAGGKSLFTYDQVQQHLAKLQANFTICSALCMKGSEHASIKNDLTGMGIEANIIKTVTTDLMQESAQTVVTLQGAIAYRLNNIAGRGIVDTRPFIIFEGSNDVLYAQISEALIKLMKSSKVNNLYQFLKEYSLTERAAVYLKELLSFEVDMQISQRKSVELGRVMSRVVSLDLVMRLGETGFRSELIENANSMLKQEVSSLISFLAHDQKSCVITDYEIDSNWCNFSLT